MAETPENPDAEYRRLLEFLYERHVRPHAPRMRDRFSHHMHDELSYHLWQAIRGTRVIRFIETHCDSPEEVRQLFTLEGLRQAHYDVHNAAAFAERIMTDGGFLNAYEAGSVEILRGLRAEYLPAIDKDVLREIGTTDADMELHVLVQNAKGVLQSTGPNSRERSVSQQLKEVYVRTEDAAKEIDRQVELGKAEKAEPPKKSRRWYKGLGQIGQGAALTIANAGLAFGAIHIPVSPETQTWGALVSVVTGIGTILNGVGDLRNE